jgi:pimeloyl-ACP methyl ester carboxylesterase
MSGRGDIVPLLSKVRVPTLFFTGAEDGLFPVEEARSQAALIRGCKLVVVERSSHQSALEAPDQVLPVLRGELGRWLRADVSMAVQ